MVYQLEIEQLQDAYRSIMKRLTEGERGEHLADAIDHIGSALRALGVDTDTLE
jgi:hypothetical protein